VYGITDGQLKVLGTTTSTSYTFSNLKEGSYKYVVSALGVQGESGPCAPISVNVTYPNMTAPATLTNKIQNVNDVVLSWTASQYAENYNLYQIAANGTKTLVSSVKGTNYTVTNAPDGSYSYAVSAVNSLYGESSLSDPTQIQITYPTMTTPEKLTYSLSNSNDITLSWSAVNYATGYKIYQIVDGQKVLKSTVTGTNVAYPNMPGGDYTYEVHSYSTRFGESQDGIQSSFTLTLPTMVGPSNLIISITKGNDITLKWDAANNATSYKVYQIVDGQKILKSTVTGTAVTYPNIPGGDYVYEVHSCSTRFGESQDGSKISSTLIPPVMQAPENLSYNISNGNYITLKWDAANNATSYKVYQIVDGQKILKNTVTGTTVTYPNMPGGDYVYEVHSCSTRFGESQDGSKVSLTLIPPSMQAPENLSYNIANQNDITLKWDSVTDATSYKVYQIVNGQKVLKSATTGTTITYPKMQGGDYVYEVYSYSTRFGESQDGSKVSLTLTPPVMQAPENLSYNISNGNDITLKWDAVNNATSYKVYQIVNGQKVLKTTLSNTTTTYTNMAGGNYVYEIHSYSDRFGESEDGGNITFSLIPPVMQPPTNLVQAVNNVTNFSLSWTPSLYATGYKVYQIIDGQKVLKSTVPSTSVSYTNMVPGEYNFEIHSFSSRFGESPDGSTITVILKGQEMQAPTNLTYSISNINNITLKWTTAPFATSYKIYQKIDGQLVLKQTVTTTSVTFTNMPSGDYDYIVNSVSTLLGESTIGAESTFSLALPKMEAPSNFAYTIANVNNITFKWDSVPYATGYKIYQIVNGEKVLKQTVTTNTASFTNMPAGDYNYEVHSFSSRFGESQDGSQTTFTLTYPTMQAPDNFAYSVANGNDVTLKWDSVPYANNYKVYQIINGEKVLKQTVAANTASFINMPAGDYNYEVHSFSSRFGESQDGSKTTFTLTYPTMQAPGNVTHTVTNPSTLTLKWEPAPYATGYKVYQIINGEKVLKQTVPTNTASFTNIPAGNYSYEIHSFSSRFGESQDGSQTTFILDSSLMLAPNNFTYSISNGNDITLKWAAAPYATSYKVYQIIDGEKVLKQTVAGNAVTFANMPAGDYNYEVHSFSSFYGESQDGSTTTFTLTHPTMQAPSSFAYVLTNINDIVLRWAPVPYANSYKVYQIIDGEKVLKQTVTGNAVTFANMPAGDYNYEVYSFSSRFGESSMGSKTTLTVTWPTMQAPGNLTYGITSGNDITLRWATVPYANNYKVYQIINGEKFLKQTVVGNIVTFANMPAGDYNYEVYSYSNRFGESQTGSTLDFSLTWPVVQPPTLNSTIYNINNITLTWNSVAWANEYRVYEIVNDTKQLLYKGTSLSYKAFNLSEGTHNFQVTAYNTRFGESDSSNTITKNIIYPIMETPVATVKVIDKTTAFISWDFVTYANGYNLYELIDNKPVLLVKNINNLSYTIKNLPVGDHLYYVTSHSNSFGESTPSSTILARIIIDSKAPVTTINTPINWSKDDATVNLTATDDISGVAKTFYSVDDASYQEGTTFTVSNEGTHKISFYSVDAAGNTETANTTYVKIDKTAPVTTSNAPTNWSKDDVTINLTATDTLSGVAKTFYSVDDADYQEGTTFTIANEGTHKISFYSVDAAGNTETSNTTYVKIDKSAPVTTSDAHDKWSKDDVTVNLNAADDISGVAKTFYSVDDADYQEGTTFTVSNEGTHKISFYSIDAAGNTETTNTTYVKIDKSAPVTTSDAPDKWSKDDVTVNLTATDDISGVAKTFYSVDNADYQEGTTFTVANEGTHKISFYSIDAAGNTETANTTYVKIDKSAPVTTSDAPDKWSKDDVTINLTATYDISGVAKTFYSVDDADYQEGTTFTVANEGTHKISFYSVDTAGNTETANTAYVKIDKAAPVTTSDAPEKWSKDDVTVNLTATDTLSGVDKTFYSIDDADYQEGTTFTVSKEGTHKISFYSIDTTGNTETANTAYVKIDKTAPTIEMKLDNEYALGSTLPAYTTHDNLSGVTTEKMVVFEPNDTTGKVVANGTGYILDKPGTYKVNISVTDAAGLTTTIEKEIYVMEISDRDIQVYSRDAFKFCPFSNTLYPRIIVKNTSDKEINLADLQLKYFFTNEGNGQSIFECDWAGLNCCPIACSVRSNFVRDNFGNSTLTLSFQSNRKLKPGAILEIQGRIHEPNWKIYNKSNDYSLNTEWYSKNDRIPVYYKGHKVCGTEPKLDAADDNEQITSKDFTLLSQDAYQQIQYNNTLYPRIKIKNISKKAIKLSDMNLKYFFTSDGIRCNMFACDYISINNRGLRSNINGNFTSDNSGNTVLNLSFDDDGKVFMPGDEIEIHCRIYNPNFCRVYNRFNDYSLNTQSSKGFSPNDKICLYVKGINVHGIEP
jgi:endonuclease YncB( thermonuclease family)